MCDASTGLSYQSRFVRVIAPYIALVPGAGTCFGSHADQTSAAFSSAAQLSPAQQTWSVCVLEFVFAKRDDVGSDLQQQIQPRAL